MAVTSLIMVRIAQAMAYFKALDLLFKRLLSTSVSIYGHQCKQITVISIYGSCDRSFIPNIYKFSNNKLFERAREARRTILSEGALPIRLVTPLPAQAQLSAFAFWWELGLGGISQKS